MKNDSHSLPQTLADRFLNEARDSHLTMSLYLLSGYQLKGEVVEVDSQTILFKHRDVHQLVMRSAVGTMYPVPLSGAGSDDWWQSYASERRAHQQGDGSQALD